jgi:hypothetical protein
MMIRITTTIACCLFLATSSLVSAREAQTVSPGATDRFVEVAGRCPTFSWAEVSEAGSYELVVYRAPLAEASSSQASVEFSENDEVLFERLPRGATGWTPARDRCLEPGASFVWFVRAVRQGDGEEPFTDGGWSAARFFAVSQEPSIAEVEEALNVLRRYTAESGDSPRSARVWDGELANPQMRPDAAAARRPGTSFTQKSVTATATASIKGEMLDPSGEAYGVIGISNSSNGAGVGAGNTNNGPDLVLDGSEDSDPDAIFTQAGIDRPSSSADTVFFLLNSDDNHVMNLHVEGSVQFAAESGDGGIFWRDPANGDLHLEVFSSKMMIDIGGGTRVTIDDTGVVSIDGTTVTVEADTLNLNGRSQLTLNAPDIDITSTGDLQLDGLTMGIDAAINLGMTAGTNIGMTAGINLDLDGTMVDVAASATTNITGSLVTIN